MDQTVQAPTVEFLAGEIGDKLLGGMEKAHLMEEVAMVAGKMDPTTRAVTTATPGTTI